MNATSSRRQLKFASLDEVILDMQRLQRYGYVSVGNWSLAQMASHMSDWASYPMDGFPRAPLPIRVFLGLLKQTWGKR